MIALLLAAVLTAPPEPPHAGGLHALCMDLSAGWQTGRAADVRLGDWAEDPADTPDAEPSTWTCRYHVRAAAGPTGRFFGVATVRLRDGRAQVDATHLALGVSGLGWVHLGLLYERTGGTKAKIKRLEVLDRMLGPEPEVVVISEVDDGETFSRTAHLCVDQGPRAAALCFAVPVAAGEGRRRRQTLDHVELRLERDGRIAFDQPPGTELELTQPYAGVHDVDELVGLSREHGRCDEGPCLRVLAFDVPVAPDEEPAAPAAAPAD